jgi:hypothetical protein
MASAADGTSSAISRQVFCQRGVGDMDKAQDGPGLRRSSSVSLRTICCFCSDEKGAFDELDIEERYGDLLDRAMTLPSKNVSLAEWSNSGKEN